MKLASTFKATGSLLLVLYRIGFSLALIVGAYFVYRFLLRTFIGGDSLLIPFILAWFITAYVTLPRIHRFLTRIYIPNYFVARTRTIDGFYGDPVNLAVIGSKKDVKKAMLEAGWVLADELSAKSSWTMVVRTLTKKSYPNAPVSSLFLFSRKQDFAFQQEVNGNPHARHHIRFWKTPSNWWLPGGREADWLAAATYDKSVGFSTWTWQFTHKIDEQVDKERDYVVQTLQHSGTVDSVEILKHFTSAFHDKNGGGDRIVTDGALPFVTIRANH